VLAREPSAPSSTWRALRGKQAEARRAGPRAAQRLALPARRRCGPEARWSHAWSVPDRRMVEFRPARAAAVGLIRHSDQAPPPASRPASPSRQICSARKRHRRQGVAVHGGAPPGTSPGTIEHQLPSPAPAVRVAGADSARSPRPCQCSDLGRHERIPVADQTSAASMARAARQGEAGIRTRPAPDDCGNRMDQEPLRRGSLARICRAR